MQQMMLEEVHVKLFQITILRDLGPNIDVAELKVTLV